MHMNSAQRKVEPEEVLSELEALGTAQNRKVYARHGVCGPQFGVSFAHLRKMGKKLHGDHSLAQALWASGNHDARLLALAVADPAVVSLDEIQRWAEDMDNYIHTDEMAKLVAATTHCDHCTEEWTKPAGRLGHAAGEWVASTGWNLVAHQALTDDERPDVYFTERLSLIEDHIPRSANRVRHCMNGALIAIGCRNPELRMQALEAAKRIGSVEVDHGETSCKTPDAAAYINKVWKRQEARRQ